MKHKAHVKNVVYCGIFISLGIITPICFHMFGAVSGQTFLPMHIPVLIAGLAVSPVCGGIAGIFSPFLSCILTDMPSFFKMPFMCIELFVYGVSAGLFTRLFEKSIKSKTLAVFLSLISAQICGRAANLLCTYIAINVLGIANPAVSVKLALLSIPAGFIGIVIQWVIIPPTVRIFKAKNGQCSF